MQLEINGHASEESLELYSMGKLEDPLLSKVEDHLLLCSLCQDQLESIDRYQAAMRSAAARLETEDESRKEFWARFSTVLTLKRVVWVMALVAIAVIGMSFRRWVSQPQFPSPVALLLETSRGSGIQRAPAYRPLELSLDTTALAAHPAYQVELVNATGRVREKFTSTLLDGQVKASLPKGLAPGSYFIRLYAPTHELLREYGLVVK